MRVSAPSFSASCHSSLVEEVVGEMPVAEEQPVAALRRRGAALLHEGAERRDAGAGPDHDDVAIGRGQREVPVGLELHAQPIAPFFSRSATWFEATPLRARP